MLCHSRWRKINPSPEIKGEMTQIFRGFELYKKIVASVHGLLLIIRLVVYLSFDRPWLSHLPSGGRLAARRTVLYRLFAEWTSQFSPTCSSEFCLASAARLWRGTFTGMCGWETGNDAAARFVRRWRGNSSVKYSRVLSWECFYFRLNLRARRSLVWILQPPKPCICWFETLSVSVRVNRNVSWCIELSRVYFLTLLFVL